MGRLSLLIEVPGTGESDTHYVEPAGVTNATAAYCRARLGP